MIVPSWQVALLMQEVKDLSCGHPLGFLCLYTADRMEGINPYLTNFDPEMAHSTSIHIPLARMAISGCKKKKKSNLVICPEKKEEIFEDLLMNFFELYHTPFPINIPHIILFIPFVALITDQLSSCLLIYFLVMLAPSTKI